MFKNKADSSRNNLCGRNVYELRKNSVPKMSQRALAELLQLNGMDVAVQRIESGQRFVTDIEIVALSKVFKVSFEELLK